MKRLLIAATIFSIALSACGGPAPELPSTASIPPTSSPPTAAPTQPPAPALEPFTVDLVRPFSPAELIDWQPHPCAGEDYSLPVSLSRVDNPQVISGLTGTQRAVLAQNGFVVIHSQEEQFSDIRISVGRNHGQPYFLTTDAAFHAFHLDFLETLKNVERAYLRPQMIAITQAALEQTLAYRPQVAGTAIEPEVEQAAVYLSVALRLFDPQAAVDDQLEPLVSQQIDQIMAGGVVARSVLFPSFEDDYGAYKPVGHYAGDPELESYFRGMTWLGRVHLKLSGDASEDSRLPLVVTLALRRAPLGDRTAAEVWADTHELLTFLVGPSDDGGPPEYASLMDQVYGQSHTVLDLADQGLWAEFLALKDQIPAPQINSTFVDWVTTELEDERGWRFMGQRFTLDGYILQNMVFDVVKPLDGQRRMLPTGLDVMAAFGSTPALQTLEERGDTAYPNYLEQMDAMQAAVGAQPEEQWINQFYNAWLHSFFPALTPKGEPYPAFMRTEPWAYKDLNAALGSWAELKHDTVLYTKMPEGAGGGGPPNSGPPPGYVEPNPLVFYRLAHLADTLYQGLSVKGIDSWHLFPIESLARSFQYLGDIAAKELAGEPLTEYDYGDIQNCLSFLECRSIDRPSNPDPDEPKPVPVVAAVAGGGDQVLEVGVGYVDRIYVVVPLEGGLHVAQGGVFSYYEFTQPRGERLTDQEWQQRLTGANPPASPPWTANFLFSGGSPTDWLAFRLDDVFIITEEGADLNLRAEPSLNAEVIRQLQPGAYIRIIDGPVQVGGYTWWKVEISMYSNPSQGWVAEDQTWYERAWGQ